MTKKIDKKIKVKNILILLVSFNLFFLCSKIYNPFNEKKVEAKPLSEYSNEIQSSEKKYTYDVKKIKNALEKNHQIDNEKLAFLTFDDGPSVITPKVLNVLKQSNVKATFFLVGRAIEHTDLNKKLVKKIYEEGHSLGNHSYSHLLNKLYPKNKINIETCINEINKTNNLIKKIVGQNFTTRVVRIPGGFFSRRYYKDPNLNKFEAELKKNNMYNIDWNIYALDCEAKNKNAGEIFEAVKNSVGNKRKVVILMHDSYGKEETVKALPRIINYLKGKGFKFKVIK
ncbi:polysaccharide deacetylase family protein [Haloimpatiens sp. FM7330]|uniref:polysaccharide deacetylase family protein n=1 Tax=Haloimpatiens sp. FM7330 TaxID=3298610 RepID=UPI00363D06EE